MAVISTVNSRIPPKEMIWVNYSEYPKQMVPSVLVAVGMSSAWLTQQKWLHLLPSEMA